MLIVYLLPTAAMDFAGRKKKKRVSYHTTAPYTLHNIVAAKRELVEALERRRAFASRLLRRVCYS